MVEATEGLSDYLVPKNGKEPEVDIQASLQPNIDLLVSESHVYSKSTKLTAFLTWIFFVLGLEREFNIRYFEQASRGDACSLILLTSNTRAAKS